VIVYEKKIIAQGVHEAYGTSHAEKKAFENLEIFLESKNFSETEKQKIFQKLEVYITLEPCADFKGKQTPSCSNLLLKYKPQKIIVGQIDPHFKGENIKNLKNSGLDIRLQENDFCQTLNPFFSKYILEKKPYICLKVAQSLNGKITNRKNKSQYLTNKKSLAEVHSMRAQYSVILTSTETVLQDNPSFNIRSFQACPPVKGDLGGLIKNNLGKKIKNTSNPNIIILGKRKIPKNFNIFKIKNRNLYFLENLKDLENFCKTHKIDSIMTECGGKLNTQLLEKNLVDEIKIFTAPLFLDKNEIPSFTQEINLKNFKIKTVKKLDSDVLIKYTKIRHLHEA